MTNNILLTLKIKVKLFFRNKINLFVNTYSWLVLLLIYLYLFLLGYLFKENLFLVTILISTFLHISNFHIIESKNWINSLTFYPIYSRRYKWFFFNIISTLLFQIILITPFLWLFNHETIDFGLIIFIIVNLISIIVLSFIVTELSYNDYKFKKISRTLILLNILTITFITSGAFDITNLTVNSNYVLIKFFKEYSFESIIVYTAFNFLISIYFQKIYFKNYYFITPNE